MEEKVIGFWQEREKYGCFSNFYPCEFFWEGRRFNCSEQAFMWSKARCFHDDEIANQILLETDPKKIKKLGRQVKGFNEEFWAEVRYRNMLLINHEKYRQNPELRKILLSTGDAKIVEDSPFDYIWGIGRDGTGQNLLGQVLMSVRQYYKDIMKEANQ